MAPAGWLDIHAHFYLPSTGEELAQNFRKECFMVSQPVTWDVDSILSYNDSAGVRMQMLSYLPHELARLQAANDYGASIVRRYPHRFGLLAALPTNDPQACLEELERTSAFEIRPDGYATSTVYAGIGLGDASLEPVWKHLNARCAVVHIHPNAYASQAQGRPAAVIEVAFDTARTVVDMLYNGVFRRYPDIRFVLGHCGGALPALSGRVSLLGTQEWVPNPNKITRTEMEEQLKNLFVDTAATAKTGLAPAVKMVGIEHVIYGADCGVPCSTIATMKEDMGDVVNFEKSMGLSEGTIAGNGWRLFPQAAKRAQSAA